MQRLETNARIGCSIDFDLSLEAASSKIETLKWVTRISLLRSELTAYGRSCGWLHVGNGSCYLKTAEREFHRGAHSHWGARSIGNEPSSNGQQFIEARIAAAESGIMRSYLQDSAGW